MSNLLQTYRKARQLKKLRKRASIENGSWRHPIGQTLRHGRQMYSTVQQIHKQYPKYGAQYAQQLMSSKQTQSNTNVDSSFKQFFANIDTVQLVVYTIIGAIALAIIIIGAMSTYE